MWVLHHFFIGFSSEHLRKIVSIIPKTIINSVPLPNNQRQIIPIVSIIQIYSIFISMSTNNQHIISALHKLINSSLTKEIYPMLESIEITGLDLDKGMMSLEINVNTSDMTYDNMYDYDFDPHYLVDYHIKRLLPYIGVEVPYISWDVNTTDGKYVTGYESSNGRNNHGKIFTGIKDGEKTTWK